MAMAMAMAAVIAMATIIVMTIATTCSAIIVDVQGILKQLVGRRILTSICAQPETSEW